MKTQIENLINDSLQLLKCRLNELGIQAKSTPEFIETANGILGSHHTLQKDKTSLEKEIQALEEETSRIRTSKEKELFETMVKTGVTEREARSIVRKHIDSTMNGLAAHVSGAKLPPSEQQRVMPLLNKLSDVTLTKCPEQQLQGTAQLPPSTQIRKRQARYIRLLAALLPSKSKKDSMYWGFFSQGQAKRLAGKKTQNGERAFRS